MTEVLVLHHARRAELVNDEHLFHGRLELQDARGSITQNSPFVGLKFSRMMTLVSRELRLHPDAAVVLQRFDRPGLVPVQLGERARVLLRDDPVAAIRAMDVRDQPAEKVTPLQAPVLRSCHDTLADAFGERVYLRVQAGYVEDPVTGTFASFACGTKSGWRIRGKSSSYQEWLPIQLEGVEGELPPDLFESADLGASQELLGKVLTQVRWASCSVDDLLKLPANRFYLPRRWSGQQWISRRELRERLERFRKESEKV
jgi:hypothetical protein